MKSRFSRLVAHLRQKTPTDRTLLALLTLLSLYLIAGAISGGRTLAAPFFERGRDLFMDYFNSLRDAAQGARVYTERRVIYPPMANLIFLVFSRFVPSAYLDTPFGARHTWRQYPTAILSLVLFLAIPLLMTALIQNAERRRLGLPRRALVPLLFNLPLLFLIERGNILLLTLPALLFFLYYYNSPRTHVRELSYLSLAFAISLKLYPVLALLFLLAQRRFAATCRVLLYSALMLLLPSLAFGGPRAFGVLLANVLSFAANAEGTAPTLLVYLPFLFSVSLFALSLFRHAKPSLCTALLGLSLFTFPALHAVYAYVFLTAPLLALLSDRDATPPNRAFRTALTLPLFLFPVLGSHGYLILARCCCAILLCCAALLLRATKNAPVN